MVPSSEPDERRTAPLSGLPGALADATIAIVLDACPENVAIVRQAVTGAGEGANVPAAQIEDMALAASEAATNVVVHAYREAVEIGPLEAAVWLAPEEVAIVVRDYGCGIRPRTDGPGLGVGIPLIGALAERVEMSVGSDGANEVRMVFPGPRRALRSDG